MPNLDPLKCIIVSVDYIEPLEDDKPNPIKDFWCIGKNTDDEHKSLSLKRNITFNVSSTKSYDNDENMPLIDLTDNGNNDNNDSVQSIVEQMEKKNLNTPELSKHVLNNYQAIDRNRADTGISNKKTVAYNMRNRSSINFSDAGGADEAAAQTSNPSAANKSNIPKNNQGLLNYDGKDLVVIDDQDIIDATKNECTVVTTTDMCEMLGSNWPKGAGPIGEVLNNTSPISSGNGGATSNSNTRTERKSTNPYQGNWAKDVGSMADNSTSSNNSSGSSNARYERNRSPNPFSHIKSTSKSIIKPRSEHSEPDRNSTLGTNSTRKSKYTFFFIN